MSRERFDSRPAAGSRGPRRISLTGKANPFTGELMNRQHNRRDFLRATALAGVGYWAAGPAAAQEKGRSANEQISFACIGVGGKGRGDTADAAKHGNVVALCDVDEQTLEKAAALYPKAKKYVDFRKLFDEM